MTFQSIRKMVIIEFFILSLRRGYLRIASVITSYLITAFVFDGIWR